MYQFESKAMTQLANSNQDTHQIFPQMVRCVNSEAEFLKGFDLIFSSVSDSMLNHQTSQPGEVPLSFIKAQSATGGSQQDSHSITEYDQPVGKDNFKMA